MPLTEVAVQVEPSKDQGLFPYIKKTGHPHVEQKSGNIMFFLLLASCFLLLASCFLLLASCFLLRPSSAWTRKCGMIDGLVSFLSYFIFLSQKQAKEK